MKVLIIEDEIRAARELKKIILQMDDTILITAIIDSIEKGKQWFDENESPDLIFSDIQLADGLCFDLFNQIELKSPIIFCTAFDEYLMNAFDTNGISYLLKPITQKKVEKAFAKFLQFKDNFQIDPTNNFNSLTKNLKVNYKTTLLVYQKEKIIPIPVREIAFFHLDNAVVSITTVTNRKFHLSSNLDDIHKTLDPEHFYRANRQYIIQRAAIENVERYFARKLVAKLMVKTPEKLIISKARASDFLKWLEGDALL
ncbi:LytTR family DNA-binding domain-containing protein [Fluviicola taffensis]|uniref:LytR/AlgR family response regulator transcription factor n=1 Tax=Fluviicola taffensis TaxID=191579 RepID=UPI0031377ADB